MKKYISIIFLIGLICSCTDQPYYEIPTDENGNVIVTGVSSTTTTGISTLDDSFSVTATFATAKVGDVMHVELLQLQIPLGGSVQQLLPIAGTQKEVTVGNDMRATITYTRDEAKLNKAGDYVVVVFNGNTDYAKQRIDMINAITITKPMAFGKEVDVARTSEVAYFNVTVETKMAAYSGNLVVKRKNGTNDSWEDVPGSPFSGEQPFFVPISGDDFDAAKDTMFYSFFSTVGSYSDEIISKIIVRDPYFYLKRTATLELGGSLGGINFLTNERVGKYDANAMIVVSDSLMLQGGSTWLASGKTIEFVPSTLAMYDLNNSNLAITAFNDSNEKLTTADPIEGEGVYIFKVVNGNTASDVYYGMIKVTSVIPNTTVSFEYRIGDRYAHLTQIK